MNPQDFSRKFVIAVRPDLQSWQVMNAVAHCAAYLGNKMSEPFDTGVSFNTSDGVQHPRNTQYPIVMLSATPPNLSALMQKARAAHVLHIGFFREMIETSDDAEIEEVYQKKAEADVDYLAVGLFGDAQELRAMTKQLTLWKGDFSPAA